MNKAKFKSAKYKPGDKIGNCHPVTLSNLNGKIIITGEAPQVDISALITRILYSQYPKR